MSSSRLALLVMGSALVAFASCDQAQPDEEGRQPRSGASGQLRATSEGLVLDAAKRRAAVTLPARADGAVAITDLRSGMKARFRLLGASDAEPIVDGNRARYLEAAPGGGELTLSASRDGVEDFVRVSQAPAEPFVYELDVQEAAGLRHVGRSLELLDEDGSPRLRVLPPWVRDADGTTHRAELEVKGCAFDDDPRPPWGRPVTAPGADRCRLVIPWPTTVERYPAVLDPAWVSAASMDANRYDHTVSMVAEDHPECGAGPFVVVAGGFRLDNGQARRSVEIYQPADGTWCQGADLGVGRAQHSATFVDTTGFDKGPNQPGGPRLVVAGGLSFAPDPSSFIAGYEALDLVTWTWAGGTIWLGRANHQALAAPNEDGEPRLVIVGGLSPFGRSSFAQQIDVDALIPPIAFAESMLYVRAGHSMTPLEDDPLHRQLIVGGCSLADDGGTGGGGTGPLPNTPPCEPWEIYCPFTACAQEGDDLPRLLFHAATRTADAVIVTGGISTDFQALASAFRFDLATETWTPLPDMPQGRLDHTSTLLDDGSVLVAGGSDGTDDLTDARRLSGDGSAWQAAGELQIPRRNHGASLLPSGAVLVMGGESDTLGTAELYIPCQTGDDCPTGAYCSPASMACSELEPDGTPCLDATPCESGLCVDGFCCESLCQGQCEACNLAGNEGECSELPPSVAPAECLPIASCVDAVTFEDPEGNQLDCTPYRCAGAACLDGCHASTDCAPGFVCDAAGGCVPPPPSSGGSCAVSAPSQGVRDAAAWLLLLAAVAFRSRRAGRDRD